MVLGLEPALGDGDVAGRRDEAGELRVGHLVAVDPEALDGDLVRRPLLRPLVVVAHGEGAALDPDHAGMRAVAFRQARIGIAEPGGRRSSALAPATMSSAAMAAANSAGGLAAAHFAASEKIVFQSFFMLITTQPFAFASSASAWGKVPTLLSGRPFAGP